MRKFLVGEDSLSDGAREHQYLGKINNDDNCHWVIVPHYYWFPEALQLKKRFALYLPDYMPHFFHATGEFVADEGHNTELGKSLAAQANVVFCNSHFTKNYLPNSRLKVDSDKIKVFYLPLLNSQARGCSVEGDLPNGLEENKYIFYPTQPRANKNLSLLLLVFDRLINRGHDLKLVLTCTLEPDPKAFAVYNSLKCKERIVILNRVSDHLLKVIYQKAALLCFTSVAEGNFPPQIHEALAYRVPVVAPNLGFIKERIPEYLAGSLLLCQADNQESFVSACETVLASDRDAILEQQDKLLEVISQEGEQDFLNKMVGMFR
ncbi:glycosyltransferase [Nitrospina watsonii]|uniref:glycosyltransferase n=1 Tax=Nitrospina watsonii TaxID=1323948 RepID=UPI00249331CC|nr:glycosyltransferase [Nitrospina watsonii]